MALAARDELGKCDAKVYNRTRIIDDVDAFGASVLLALVKKAVHTVNVVEEFCS